MLLLTCVLQDISAKLLLKLALKCHVGLESYSDILDRNQLAKHYRQLICQIWQIDIDAVKRSARSEARVRNRSCHAEASKSMCGAAALLSDSASGI